MEIQQERFIGVYYDQSKHTANQVWANKDVQYGSLYSSGYPPPIVGSPPNTYNDLYVTSGTSKVHSGDNTIYVATDAGTTTIQEYKGNEAAGQSKHYTTGSFTSFSDNCNDGSLDGWTSVGSNVAIETGELSCSGYPSNSAGPTSLVLSDFTLEYDMKIINNSGTTETYFRADDITKIVPNGYMFSFRSDSSTIALYKFVNNAWRSLKSTTFPHNLNKWHRIKIMAVGSTIQVYVDGIKYIDVTDATYLTGKVRLGSWEDPNFGWTNEHVHFDNVQINDLTQSLAGATSISAAVTALADGSKMWIGTNDRQQGGSASEIDLTTNTLANHYTNTTIPSVISNNISCLSDGSLMVGTDQGATIIGSNQINWQNIVSLSDNLSTSGGLGSYLWDTSALPEGDDYKIRIRASDGTSTYPEGMVSYWKFDEGAGATAADSVDANHGTIKGAMWTTGRVDEALSFNGVDNFVDVTPSSSVTNGNSEMSVEAWIRLNDYGNLMSTTGWTIVGKGQAFVDNDTSWHLGIGAMSSGDFSFGKRIEWSVVKDNLQQNNSNRKDVRSSCDLELDTWYYVVGTFKNNDLKIYINGEDVTLPGSRTGIVNGLSPTSQSTVKIGKIPGLTNAFSGLIDEAAIYNRALAPEEIQQHYNSKIYGTPNFGPYDESGTFSIYHGPVITDVSRDIGHPNANDEVNISAKVTDSNGLQSTILRYSFDEIAWQDVSMSDSNEDNVFEGTIPAPGVTSQVSYKMIATNTEGKSTTSDTENYAADGTSPDIQSFKASPNPVDINTPTTFSASISDNVAVDSVFMTVDQTVLSMSYNSTSGLWATSTPILASGRYTADLTTIDKAGNVATTSTIVRVVTASEKLSVLPSFDKDSFVPDEDITIRAIVTDENNLAIPGAQATAEIMAPSGATTTLNLLNDGAHGDAESNDGVYANTFSSSEQGVFTITYAATKDFMIPDTNTAYLTITRHDLGIVGGSQPGSETRGNEVSIRADIHNYAHVSEGATVELIDLTDNLTIDSKTAMISAHATKSINLSWDTSDSSIANHELLLRVTSETEDSNPANNEHSFQINIVAPIGPKIAVSPASVNVVLNKGQSKSIEVITTNIGDEQVQSLGITTSGEYIAPITSSTQNLNPGAHTRLFAQANVPYEAAPGTYVGAITIQSSNANNATVPVSIEVTDVQNAETKVFVHDAFGNPIPDATVVFKESGGAITTASTDGGGYTNINIASGDYEIYGTKNGYQSTAQELTLNPTPPGTGPNEVDLLLIEDDVLAVEVIVTDISGQIVDYVEAGVAYHFEVKYYVKEDKTPPPTTSIYIPSSNTTVSTGWHVVPSSGSVQTVRVATPQATYVPAPSHSDLLTTIEITGDVYQMKQMFDVKAKVYNKGGMTIEDVTTNATAIPSPGLRLHSQYPSQVYLGDIQPLSNAMAQWIYIGDAAGDYTVSVKAEGYIIDTKVTGEGSSDVHVDPLAILSFDFPALDFVTKDVPIDWTITINNNNDYPAYSVTAVLGELKNIGLAPGEIPSKFLGTIDPHTSVAVTWKLIPEISGTIEYFTANVTYPEFGVAIKNRAPVAEAGESYIGYEGHPVSFDGSLSSDSDGNELTYEWDFDGDGETDADGVCPTYVWIDDYSGEVTLTVSDGQLTSSDTAPVTINNVAPTANAGPDQQAYVGETVNFVGSAYDPGLQDNPTGSWTFGDGNGAIGFEVSHSYETAGFHKATLTAVDKDMATDTDEAIIKVERRPTTITYTGDISGDYSDAAYLKATLQDNEGTPLSEEALVFSIDGQEVAAVTDLLGEVQAVIEIDQSSGIKDLAVSFAGDNKYQATTSHTNFEVTRETASIKYLGDTITQRYQDATLKAQLSENDLPVGDLSGKTIIFTITDGTNTQEFAAITDANGVATTEPTQIFIPASLYNVTASFAGDEFYQGSSTKTPYVVWQVMPGLNINGGGWLEKDNKKCNFGFTAKYVNNSDFPKGQLEFIDRSTGQNIHSEGFGWLVLDSQNLAILHGSATINGESGHTFRMMVSDLGTPGKDIDTFDLEIDCLPVISGLLDGGNIVIH